jgi:ATP-binding cassette subfamily B protein
VIAENAKYKYVQVINFPGVDHSKTLEDVFEIIVVNNGSIIEQGTHDKLLANGGLYKRMWEAHIDAGAWELACNESREGV